MKKRLMSLLLLVGMALSLLPAASLRAMALGGSLLGDADGDGYVNMGDVYLIEAYIADPSTVTSIDTANADVNGDSTVDETDADLIREYLAGNIHLTDQFWTVTFETDGGGTIDPIQVGKGYAITQEIPAPAKEGYIFTGWQMADGQPFYQSEPVVSNLTLTATYQAIDPTEQLYIDSFALTEQDPALELRVSAPGMTAEQVKAALTLLTKDGSDPVELIVTAQGGNLFGVKADGGFRPGGTYELTIGDGLTFAKEDGSLYEDYYRTVALTFTKQEEDTIQFSDDVIFLQHIDTYHYYRNPTDSNPYGQSLEVLEIPIYASGETEITTGRISTIDFDSPLSNLDLQVGDVVCVYETVDPRNRDYTQDLYEDDAIAYIRITDIELGGIEGGYTTPSFYYFESLGEEDLDEVVLLPDTIPYRVETLPAGGKGTTGTVDANGYDHAARAALGLTEAPAFKTGDLLVFYAEDFAALNADSSAVYAKVTGLTGTTVAYEIIDKDDIEDLTGGLFVSTPISVDDLDTTALQNALAADLAESDFADEAVDMMASAAFQTPTIQAQLMDMGLSSAEISALAASPMAARAGLGGGRTKYTFDGASVTPGVHVNDRYEDGYGMSVQVSAGFTVSRKVGSGTTATVNELKIELSAYFEQQGAFGLSVDASTDWDVYVIIPVLKEVNFSVAVDVKSYSNISLSAKTYTVSREKKESYNELIKLIRDGEYTDALRELNQLRLQRKLGGGKDVQDQIDSILGSLPKVNVGGQEYSFEELEAELNMTDVSSEFEEVLSAQSEEESRTGLEVLMSKYSALFDDESGWAQVLNHEMFSKEYHIKILAVKLSVNFIVSVDVNLTMGMDLEYEMGKRYSFWVKIFAGKSGSSETDLLDERFGFQFYIMGYIGARFGFKIDVAVGIISTSIASVGANLEVGPYIKLYGYFVYTYTKFRPANTTAWDVEEQTLGALYLDFGIYLTVKFKAQALKDLIKYEPTLYDGEFSLITAGQKKNIYDFALDPGPTDLLYILDEDQNETNGVTMELPEAYRNMKTIDMTTGQRAQGIYDISNYHIRFTNPAFSIDDKGIISFDKGSLAEGTRYVQGDMIITWSKEKLPFSQYDMSITVPVVWTSYSQSEISKLYNAYVAVGNATYGYQVVWSGQFNRTQTFDLPTQEEILELVGYDAYTAEDSTNLKYSGTGGYTVSETTGITLQEDTTYYYDLPLREYSLTVEGIQKADGSLTGAVYTTIYGEPFAQLASLADTGADDAESGTYTVFQNLTVGESADTFPLDTRVDMSFLEQYGTSATLTANYTDAARTATFTFLGVSVPDYSVTFRARETPDTSGINAHLAEYVKGGTVKVNGISPVVAPSDSSVTYTVSCIPLSTDTPTYDLSFVVTPSEDQTEEDMPTIDPVAYPQGSIVFAPTLPTLAGAYLDGWYKDPECTQPFDFGAERMPGEAMTLYAKYISTMVDVHIMQNATTELELRQVPNGSALGALPELGMTTTQRLVGWYDNPAFTGEAYTAETIIRSDGDLYLYPYVSEKLDIGLTAEDFTPYHGVYSPTEWGVVDFMTGLNDSELYAAGMFYQHCQVLWRKQGVATSVEWTEVPIYSTAAGWPQDAGAYNVRLIWPGNENYKPLDLFLDSFIVIEKAPFPVSGGGSLAQPDLTVGKTDIAVYLPDNFDRYTFGSNDNKVTIRVQYLRDDFTFGDYTTVTMPIFDGEGISGNPFLCNISVDVSQMPDRNPNYGESTEIRVRLEFSEGSNYYGATTPYAGGLLLGEDFFGRSAAPMSASALLSATPMNAAAPMLLGGTEDLAFTADDVKTMAGKTFGLSLRLENNTGLWGFLAQLDYPDGAPFHLVGYSVGNVFPGEGFTLRDDWGADPFRLVVNNTVQQDITSEETVITLWYYVDENAQPGKYNVAVSLESAVDAAGQAVTAADAQVEVWVAEDKDFTAETPTATMLAENGYVYAKGNAANTLYVTASVSDGGALSYQWYRYESDQAQAQPISGATLSEYTPPTDAAGVWNYFCRVTNTLSTLAGIKTASADTEAVNIEVLEQECRVTLDPVYPGVMTNGSGGVIINTLNGRLPDLGSYAAEKGGHTFTGWYTAEEGGERVTTQTVFRQAEQTIYAHYDQTGEVVNADTPTITGYPTGVSAAVGERAWLYVDASVGDGGTLSYQWYESSGADNENGTFLAETRSGNYYPDTAQEGIRYYYCVVTNTNMAPNITGNQVVSAKTPAIPVYVGTAYITLDPQGGTVDPDTLPLRLSYGEFRLIGTLPTPAWEDHTFTGWYTEREGGEQVKDDHSFENACTIYARWGADAATPVIQQQPDDDDNCMVNYTPALNLQVEDPVDGGELSYQWYRCNADGSGGVAVAGETESWFAGLLTQTGTFYYYCVVTNTNRNAPGSQTASVRSDVVRVTVSAPTGVENAAPPSVGNARLDSAQYGTGAQAEPLLFSAFTDDGGVISYQWYVSGDATSGGTAIPGATQSTFTPPTTTPGTLYYYCVATNTNQYATVNKTASTTSARAEITVKALEAPVITVQPQDAAYRVGETAQPLTVAVTAPEDYTVTYRWYEEIYSGDVMISSGSSFVPPTHTQGSFYYYCVVTVESGGETLEIKSRTAAITVNPADYGEFLITFDPNGGVYDVVSQFTYNGRLSYLGEPVHDTMDFDGWYTEREGGTYVTTGTSFTRDTTLYAHWTERSPEEGEGGGTVIEVSRYAISVENIGSGSVSAGRDWAYVNSTVSLTVTPAAGESLLRLTVTDGSGAAVEVRDLGGGKYSFTMPESAVTVRALFSGGPESCGLGADCPAARFEDLDLTAWYHDGIHYCAERGLMNGVSADAFAPSATATRAMLVTTLWYLEGRPQVNYLMSFADVGQGLWYTEAVRWAASEGIVEGYSDAVFAPGDPITRQQMAVLFYRYAQYKGWDVSARSDLSGYEDASEISAWAQSAMSWANAESLVTGVSAEALTPKAAATRAQVATMLLRFCRSMGL